MAKYTLFDQFDELRNADVKLVLGWDIMPFTGLLSSNFAGNSTFTMPTVYV
jgi:hypothetical protein